MDRAHATIALEAPAPYLAQVLRRYHGKLTTSELARYPATLSKYAPR